MNDLNDLFGRHGGKLILLLALVLMWGGWRLTRSDTAVSQPNNLTPAGTLSADIVEVTPFVITVDELAATPAVIYAPGELPVLSETGLSPDMVPLTFQGLLPEHQFEMYVVERGDTPNGIADRFSINAETLLGGNPQLSQESSLLQTGVELIILPIDGVLHDVGPGDTLESVSAQYGISVADIIAYAPNKLEFPYRLYPETQIMVPGAVREIFVWNPPELSSVVGGTSWEGRSIRPLIVGTGSFIYPVAARNYTQYYWYGHRAIDIGLPEGNAVFAADDGTVTYAGWNTYGYGNLIVVNHGNGFETFYAHLSGINVVAGQIVFKGNVIGSSGNSGNSSGPHIHFEIRLNGNQDNPCWYVGC